jgi:peptide/nickel transport system permease protein
MPEVRLHVGSVQPAVRTSTFWHRFRTEWRTKPVFGLAVVLFVVFVLVALVADWLAPHGVGALDLRSRMLPPGIAGGHLLGTDELGRDVLSQVIYGIRTSLLIAGAAALLAAAVGSLFGTFAGLVGGAFDTVLMRLVDMQLAVPAFFLALAGSVVLGRGVVPMMLVLAIVGWAQFARVGRASALAIREEPYVEAARGLGAGQARIGLTHVLPNVIAPLLFVFSVGLPNLIMVEASLSFVGMGLPASVPSLGSMINRGYPHLLSGAWWISILPGVALMLLVLSINTITDSLRDILDVKLSS